MQVDGYSRLEKLVEAVQADQLNADKVFTLLDFTGARQKASQACRAHVRGRSSVDGWLISIKDNIDLENFTTTAGSAAFLDEKPATSDATIVSRLRAAGSIIFGKTNMTEIAYSTPGINRYFGTPLNPSLSDGTLRLCGGSSTGAAAALAQGWGDASIGTDTAGSVRIPAALCGLVGIRPRQARVPTKGVLPLSISLDSVGILAPTVDAVRKVFAAISSEDGERLSPSRHPRLLLPVHFFENLDAETSHAFEAALTTLRHEGWDIVRGELSLFTDAFKIVRNGGIIASEAYSFHKSQLEKRYDRYEKVTLSRLRLGKECSAENYINLLQLRQLHIAKAQEQLASYDAVLFPTCPIIAPEVDNIKNEESFLELNNKLLRHTVFANIFDLPSVTLPCHYPSQWPVGLSLMSASLNEESLLFLAEITEKILSKSRGVNT
ncbi:amidase family protein [Halomonas sp. GXIMD04776]|uniref:amidase family protein n=1 Tax=Halomonas sp. GXIMD04776 TaxID=3415605 RepID=UPI003CC2A822